MGTVPSQNMSNGFTRNSVGAIQKDTAKGYAAFLARRKLKPHTFRLRNSAARRPAAPTISTP